MSGTRCGAPDDWGAQPDDSARFAGDPLAALVPRSSGSGPFLIDAGRPASVVLLGLLSTGSAYLVLWTWHPGPRRGQGGWGTQPDFPSAERSVWSWTTTPKRSSSNQVTASGSSTQALADAQHCPEPVVAKGDVPLT